MTFQYQRALRYRKAMGRWINSRWLTLSGRHLDAARSFMDAYQIPGQSELLSPLTVEVNLTSNAIVPTQPVRP